MVNISTAAIESLNNLLLFNKISLKCKHGKTTIRKRFSRFFSKMLRNFNQATPAGSSTNRRFSMSLNKHGSDSHDDYHVPINNKYNPMGYNTQYRRRSILRRTSTLTSIKEENEAELLNSL